MTPLLVYVPEGHHPRGATLREGGNLLLRVLQGSMKFSEGSDPMLVTWGPVAWVRTHTVKTKTKMNEVRARHLTAGAPSLLASARSAMAAVGTKP